MWVLEIKPKPSAKAAGARNHKASSPALVHCSLDAIEPALSLPSRMVDELHVSQGFMTDGDLVNTGPQFWQFTYKGCECSVEGN